MSVASVILALFCAWALLFALLWWREMRRARVPLRTTAVHAGIGALTNFFDTLGVGSFATTASLYRLGGLVATESIPGTLNLGHALPTIAQALIFVKLVPVAPTTLVGMMASAVAGAWLGAGLVATWSRPRIQTAMGVLLLVAALVMVVRLLAAVPPGTAQGLRGARLGIGCLGAFGLGALMTVGIGFYAPCMILVSLLGMSERSAFPVMMGACASLAPLAGLRFARHGRYDARAALGLTLGGIPAVLLAGLVVHELSLLAVKWLVVGVVIYTAMTMLRASRLEISPSK